MIEMSDEMIQLHIDTAKSLKSHVRRRYMAKVVRALGYGGKAFARREFGWDRRTIIKGMHELDSGFICFDNYQARGRKKAEELLPELLVDIIDIVDSQSQSDPRFRHARLYCMMSAEQVRTQLISQKGYKAEELPTPRVLRRKLNQLGYTLKRVQKTKPKKNS